MNESLNRRAFLSASAAAALAAGKLSAAEPVAVAAEPAPARKPFKTKLHKSLIRGMIPENQLQQLKAAGFEGIECGSANAKPAAAEKFRALAEKCGIRIHSVLRGWVNFNNPNKDKVARDIAAVETALRAAKGFGADAILLVPCRTGGMPMPKPWEFDIEFDKKCHVTRVAKGDNEKYKKYIDAQNLATDTTREAMKKLIPVAEQAGVVIALENVWNNLWVKPKLFAAFIRSLNSKWAQTYFDIGNHVRYALPEQWIAALGETIVKCHIKDFKLNDNGQGGNWANIRDGSVNWPVVRKALDDVGYNGWMTIEGSGRLSLEELNKRLSLIIAGK